MLPSWNEWPLPFRCRWTADSCPEEITKKKSAYICIKQLEGVEEIRFVKRMESKWKLKWLQAGRKKRERKAEQRKLKRLTERDDRWSRKHEWTPSVDQLFIYLFCSLKCKSTVIITKTRVNLRILIFHLLLMMKCTVQTCNQIFFPSHLTLISSSSFPKNNVFPFFPLERP